MERRLPLIGLVLLLTAGWGTFGLNGTMICDDYGFIFEAEPGETLPTGEMAARIWRTAGVSRFLTHLLHRRLFPEVRDCFWVAHAAVLAVHGLNVWLMFRFARRALGGDGPAFLAAAFFGLWPVACEVTYWATQINYHLAVALLLVIGVVWLRADPQRPGWWRRAWPVWPLSLLLSQFNEQALCVTAALAGLTAFAGEGPLRGRLLRFAAHGAYLAAPVAIYLAAFFATLDRDAMRGTHQRTLPTRYEVTPAGDLPFKVLWTLERQAYHLPMVRWDRQMLVGSVRRLPEFAGEFPAAWAALLLPVIGGVLAWRSRAAPDEPLPAGRLPGALLFAALAFLAAAAPLVATREQWPALRLGFVPSVGMHLASAAVVWTLWRLAAARWAWSAAAGRVALGGLLGVDSFVCLTEGWQYDKQHRINLAHAGQIRAQLADDPGPRRLLIGHVQWFAQPLTVRHHDHIISAWIFPWATAGFLRHQFGDEEIRYHSTGGHQPFDPQQVLDDVDGLYVFTYAPRDETDAAHTPPDSYALRPVRNLEFVDRGGGRRRVRLPRMAEVRPGAGTDVVEVLPVPAHDVRALRFPED
jgi:hypothetical protein